MDEKIVLNDGTEIAGTFILSSSDRLYLYMNGIGFADAFNALINPSNTNFIKWERNGESGTLKGYKHLYSVTEENETLVTAALRK